MITISSTTNPRWRCLLAVCAFLISVAATSLIYGATIRIGDHSLLPNTANQMLLIAVAGGEQIAGADFFALIGDGGPESVRFGLPAGTPAPRFANPAADVSLQTGIFSGNNLGQVDLLSGLGGSAPQLAAFGILTNTGTVAADGTLAKLIVDTTGFTGGTWSLNLRSPAGDTTLLNSAGAPINLVVEPGLITVIPEPANIVLAITALILVGAMASQKLPRRRMVHSSRPLPR